MALVAAARAGGGRAATGVRVARVHKGAGASTARSPAAEARRGSPLRSALVQGSGCRRPRGGGVRPSRACVCRATSGEEADGELPDALKGVRLSEDGETLIDERGDAINELGATRFDVAVQAMRGAFDRAGATGEDSTERDSSQILDALVRFPAPYTFKIVLRPDKEGEEAAEYAKQMADEYVDTLAELGVLVDPEVVVQPYGRSGRYWRLKLTAPMVAHAALVSDAFAVMDKDARIVYKL